jgi:hypothetical protein
MNQDQTDRPTHEVWVVDRVESGIAVLIEDEGEIVVEVSTQELGANAVEGAVLVVPLGAVGEPVWEEAVRDDGSEGDRVERAEEILERLRSRDPGGDIST